MACVYCGDAATSPTYLGDLCVPCQRAHRAPALAPKRRYVAPCCGACGHQCVEPELRAWRDDGGTGAPEVCVDCAERSAMKERVR